MDSDGAAPAAGDVGEPAAERDVLRRPVALRTREHATGARVVDGELEPIAGADPDVAAVGCPCDVVRTERRRERSDETGTCSRREVDDRDLLGLRAQGD